MRWLSLLLLLLTVPGRAQAPATPACADAESCLTEGLRLAEGLNASADASRAASMLRLGCGKGSGLACAHAEILQAAYGEPGASRAVSAADAEQARQRLETDCASGVAQSCYLFGVAVENGLGVAADMAVSLRLYEQACGGNVARACYRQGQLLDAGPAAWRDPVQADELYRQACKGNEPRACFDLAKKLAPAQGSVSDSVAQLYERGCSGDYLPSCTALAKLHLDGRLSKPDPAEAKRLLDRACKGGEPDACQLR